MDKNSRGGTRVYKICTCPSCRKRFVAKLHNSENSTVKTDSNIIEQVLNDTTVKTLSCDGELEESIQDALKPVIQDEQLYEEVMKHIRAVYEAHI